MKTDKLFYEYFQLVPNALFELLQIEPDCDYVFTSPVIKSAERRFDGLLEPSEAGKPHYFLEIQGYRDTSIYWRGVHQLGWFHELYPEYSSNEWKIIFLFLDESHDPGIETLGSMRHGCEHWLMRHNFDDLLRQATKTSPALHVLRPLIANNVAEVEQHVAEWVEDIRHLPKNQAEQDKLLDLLAQFIVQKFNSLTRKETDKMLQLTPIEETVVGQELIMEGRVEGQAIVLTDLISQKYGVPSSISDISALSPNSLQELGRYLLWADDYEDVQNWINDHKIQKF